MNYELAQRLKDAGFPQHNEENNTVLAGMPQAYIPNLSELIETCGKCQFELKQWPIWEARAHVSGLMGIAWQHIIKTGSTPEEAVAHLWLALNEKKV